MVMPNKSLEDTYTFDNKGCDFVFVRRNFIARKVTSLTEFV